MQDPVWQQYQTMPQFWPTIERLFQEVQSPEHRSHEVKSPSLLGYTCERIRGKNRRQAAESCGLTAHQAETVEADPEWQLIYAWVTSDTKVAALRRFNLRQRYFRSEFRTDVESLECLVRWKKDFTD